jgi:hypothetical protein
MTKEDVLKAYKSNLRALDETIKLLEVDIANLKKIKRNLEIFISAMDY